MILNLRFIHKLFVLSLQLSKNATKCNWICSIRNKHLRCPASVCQVDGTFTPGIYDHKHLPGEKTEK